MPWIKIFISHSTKTEEARAFLDAVADALREDFDVRLDATGLKGGDDWRAKLYEWMEEVHGAVLLLTSEALDSKFVQIEASVLSWRRFRQPKFVLLPVLVGGVGVEELSKGIFGEMELNRIQAVSLENPPALAAEVARLLRVLKERDTPRTAKEALEHRVIKLLKRENEEEDLLDAGREALGWTNRSFASGEDCCEKFARDLMSADTRAACAAVMKLAEGGMSRALELLHLVVPSWIEEEAARPIAKLALGGLPRLAVSLNAADRWTLHAYIGRSCHTSLSHGLDVCELTPPGTQDSLNHFRRQILDYFKPKDPFAPPTTPEEVKGFIKSRDELARPVFVVFPPGYVPDAPLLDSLRAEFETVTFFVLADDAPPEKLSAVAGKVVPLKPLDPARRRTCYALYTTAYAQLDRKAQEGTPG
jgi:TIR domain